MSAKLTSYSIRRMRIDSAKARIQRCKDLLAKLCTPEGKAQANIMLAKAEAHLQELKGAGKQ